MEISLKALQEKMGKLHVGGGEEQAPPPPKVLDELTVEGVVKHIRKLQAAPAGKSESIRMYCKDSICTW